MADPFFVVVEASGALSITRPAQRFLMLLDEARIRIRISIRVRVRVRIRIMVKVRVGGTYFYTHIHARQGCRACGLMRVGLVASERVVKRSSTHATCHKTHAS